MMAMGMFISSLTESVVVAAFVTFAILLVIWILGWQAGPARGQRPATSSNTSPCPATSPPS